MKSTADIAILEVFASEPFIHGGRMVRIDTTAGTWRGIVPSRGAAEHLTGPANLFVECLSDLPDEFRVTQMDRPHNPSIAMPLGSFRFGDCTPL